MGSLQGWANGLIRGERYAVSYEDDKVQQRLSGYLYAGVTTVLDVGNDHDWVVKKRDQINGGKLFGPRAFVCGGAWSQAPSGWESGGTSGDFGLSTKVTSIAQIPEQMDRYVKDGIEIINAGGDAQATVSGKEITPFLLQRIFELSAGASLEANVQLILNNARLGAQIALAVSELESRTA